MLIWVSYWWPILIGTRNGRQTRLQDNAVWMSKQARKYSDFGPDVAALDYGLMSVPSKRDARY
jgi:hypothetical protein